MLLTHTSGFCPNSTEPAGSGTSYAQMQAMIKNGPQGTLGAYGYCNAAYGLLRIVLPYLVDGPQAYKRFEGDAGKGDTAKIDQLTSMGYRNYVRGRILDPIGLSGVDEFYTYTNVGSPLETLYFNSNGLAIYDDLNFPSPLTGGTLSPSMSTWWAKADNQVLASGAGYWSLSAQEYSLLISRFWMGDIVSRTNGSCAQALNTSCLSEMVADYSKANETGAQGFGMNVDKMILTADATTRWSYDKNGGGASSTAWITFFNGYTAVFIQNSFPFSIGDTKPEHMLQGVFNAALTKP
jgi:CubicO group peptidase (beta-lactamase class C family)